MAATTTQVMGKNIFALHNYIFSSEQLKMAGARTISFPRLLSFFGSLIFAYSLCAHFFLVHYIVSTIVYVLAFLIYFSAKVGRSMCSAHIINQNHFLISCRCLHVKAGHRFLFPSPNGEFGWQREKNADSIAINTACYTTETFSAIFFSVT